MDQPTSAELYSRPSPLNSIAGQDAQRCAAVHVGKAGSWLPCTNVSTVRQKFQRAFAQEFLCPYWDLIEWMNTTSPNDETMEAATEHFDVSSLLVNTVMVNHSHRPRSEL